MKFLVLGTSGNSSVGTSCGTLEGAVALAKALLIDGCTKITIEVRA
jgi:hypothetical protein